MQAAFDSFGCQVLTDREREVAHMILRGHRKNLYLKLEINSPSELFACFIEWLRQPGQGIRASWLADH